MFEAHKNKSDASLKSRPDLIVVDGGKGKLGSAEEVLRSLKLTIPLVALAKRKEEVFVPGAAVSLNFSKDSPARFLLMRLRDEAHRFANRHRANRASKRATHSPLEDVPGIGTKTHERLLKKFGSLTAVRAASDADLRSVLTAKQVEALREHL